MQASMIWFLQMAQLSTTISQAHKATALYFLISKRGLMMNLLVMSEMAAEEEVVRAVLRLLLFSLLLLLLLLVAGAGVESISIPEITRCSAILSSSSFP